MKPFLRIAFLLIVMVLFGGIYFWYQVGKPERTVKANQVMSAISYHSPKWESRVNLIPILFTELDDKESVESKLQRNGFSHNEDFEFYHVIDVVKDGESPWSANHSTMVCRVEYVVLISVNSDGLLNTADGLIGERGCL